MGYEACTSVQADAIPTMLSGADVVCKAKTGTGKTLAFLIPAIEATLKNPPPPGSVGVLVISPARELAMQIETEAKQLTEFHNLTTQVSRCCSALRPAELMHQEDKPAAERRRCFNLQCSCTAGMPAPA